MALIGKNVEEKIWNYLKAKGLNDYGCAGFMGNMYAESGLNPMNLQNSANTRLGMTDEEYCKAVDNGTYTNFADDRGGWGLVQLTYPALKKDFLEYAQKNKKSVGDLELQLDYLMVIFNGEFKSVLNTLKTATSVLEASNAVLLKFERPADQSVANQNKRASYGQKYYDKYAKSNTTQSSTTTTANNNGGGTMTEKQLREKVVAIAKSYLGCNEADGSHKKIIDGYNAVTPLPRSYKVKYTDAWCATYVSFVGIKAGLTDIMPRECGCGAMIQLYQNLGRWIEKDSYIPDVADIIMYDWDDNGSGECTGYPEHVGIVVSVEGNTIKVIEGNKNNSVEYRTLAVNGRYIRGYCVPNYASKATSVDDTLNKTVKWNGYVLASKLNVRAGAGTKNKTCSFSPLKKDTVVGVCDSVKDTDGVIWYFIKYNNEYGFVSSKYIQKKTTVTTTTPPANNKVESAESYLKSVAGTYKTTANLNLRTGAGTDKKVLCTIPKGEKVKCYGYYTTEDGVRWYLVAYETRTGFVSSKYLKKVRK